MYLGIYDPPTPAMEAGTEFHKLWEKEGRKTGKLPGVFGKKTFDKPLFEKETKKEVMLNDWLKLVLVLDVKEQTNGIDYKSGVGSASSYANSYQHRVYQVGYPELKTFEYYVFNQHTDEVTMSIVHLTRQTLLEGVQFVLKNATEMRTYVIANNIEMERKAS